MKVGEIDFAERLWTVPAERMKSEDDASGAPHAVPLCDRAIEILQAAIPENASPDAYVFAGQWSEDHAKPLGMNAVLHALQAVYPSMTRTAAGPPSAIGRVTKHGLNATSPKWRWPTKSATTPSKPTGAAPR
jgi:hypothetical protein